MPKARRIKDDAPMPFFFAMKPPYEDGSDEAGAQTRPPERIVSIAKALGATVAGYVDFGDIRLARLAREDWDGFEFFAHSDGSRPLENILIGAPGFMAVELDARKRRKGMSAA